MRQLRLIAMLLCALGVLTATSFAQEAAEKATTKPKTSTKAAAEKAPAAKKKPPAHWVKLEDGVEVLKLFESDLGPRWPEIAILRLSDAKHNDFEKDPKEFLNSRHVFSKDTRSVKPFGRPPKEKGKKAMPDDWFVVLNHDVTSDSLYFSETGTF